MVAQFRNSLQYFATETYSGSPSKASAELGEQFLDVLGEKAAEALSELLDGNLPRDQWHSPVWKLRQLFVNTASVRLFDRLLDTPRGV